MSPISKAQQRAVAKYTKENYDELKIRLTKGKKQEIQICAEKKSQSLNSFVAEAIEEKIERESK